MIDDLEQINKEGKMCICDKCDFSSVYYNAKHIDDGMVCIKSDGSFITCTKECIGKLTDNKTKCPEFKYMELPFM